MERKDGQRRVRGNTEGGTNEKRMRSREKMEAEKRNERLR